MTACDESARFFVLARAESDRVTASVPALDGLALFALAAMLAGLGVLLLRP